MVSVVCFQEQEDTANKDLLKFAGGFMRIWHELGIYYSFTKKKAVLAFQKFKLVRLLFFSSLPFTFSLFQQLRVSL